MYANCLEVFGLWDGDGLVSGSISYSTIHCYIELFVFVCLGVQLLDRVIT